MSDKTLLATGPLGRRSWTFTIVFAVIWAAGAYGAWFFYGWTQQDDAAKSFIGWPLLVVAALISTFGLLGVIFPAKKSKCPSCGRRLDVPEEDYAAHCEGCDQLVESRDKRLCVVAEDRIDEAHRFRTPVESSVVWPEACVICGAPPQKHESVSAPSSLGLTDALATLGRAADRHSSAAQLTKTTGTGPSPPELSAPHCAAHSDGVRLERWGGGFCLCFRSVPQWRAFRRANERPP